MDRCALFVDAGYLLADGAMAVHGTRHREAVSWDYPGLLQLLTALSRERTGLPMLRCYWYEATVEGRRTPEHDTLADIPGLKLRLSRIRPGRREGVDAQVHRDLMTLARNSAICDAVVVSGDEDLAQVVCDAQDLGIRVTVVHIAADGNWAVSRTLRQECDDLIEMGAGHLRSYVSMLDGGNAQANGHHPATPSGNGPPQPAQSQPGQSQGGQAALPGGQQTLGLGTQNAAAATTGALTPTGLTSSGLTSSGLTSSGLHSAPLTTTNTGSTGAHSAPSVNGGPTGGHAAPPTIGNTQNGNSPAGASAGSTPTQHPGRGQKQASSGQHASQPSGQHSGQHGGQHTGQHGAQHSSQTGGQSGGHHSGQSGGQSGGQHSGQTALPSSSSTYPGYPPPEPPQAAAPQSPPAQQPAQQPTQQPGPGAYSPTTTGGYPPTSQTGSYTGPQAAPVPPQSAPGGTTTLAEAVKAAHKEGHDFGESVARDAPALWLEAVLARKPRMPSDLEARLLQGSSLPIDFLLHDEVRHALRRGFWDALERARR
ncbi:NYN domain-containing protein [Spongiactinospora sp. TRM90649]|uniref:NYN domain-containing protein n=1 Tax=Spongiactinospora sp. TRM90649 TaxID=3031114 RepID=UPI0023FA4A6F|nr:NYN domain-containing protein [Spongiactinospora sp. TRM90649]MDF5757484.1 NYN domain-containing protein [Spongiactinospora sp. TRM90649]